MHTDPSSPSTARVATRRSRRLLAAALAMAALSGCAAGTTETDGAGSNPPAGTTVPAPTESTPADESDEAGAAPDTELLDSLLGTRDEDGRMPRESALTAFAAVYGGLPEVDAAGLTAEGIEGTTAARWLSAHRDGLTDRQRDAIDRAMAPLDIDGSPLPAAEAPESSAHGMRSGVQSLRRPAVDIFGERGCFGGAFPFADAPDAGKYRDIVRLALAELSLLLGPLDIPVYTAFSDFEGINADLNPWAPDCDEPAQACQIRLAPLALQMPDSTLVKTLAHELTHCYQARAVGATAIASMPDWLVEGFPSYVAETVGVSIGNTTPNYWWDKWFKNPSAPLYQRTYDALGFYAVVKQAGGDPFGRYMTALKTKDSSAAFGELIAGVGDHVGTIWGSTHFRQVERGLFWELDGPGATGYKPALPPSTITNGGGHESALGEAEASANIYTLQAEVVVVTVSGPVHGRYSFTGVGADEVLTSRHEWCTLGYPCVCPDDTARAGTVVDQAPADELAIGSSGLANGGIRSVRGMTFEDYCGKKRQSKPEPPATTAPPVVDECLVGTWVGGQWTIPGPPGTDLTLSGGAGISMVIEPDGSVTTDFADMAPMTGAFTTKQTGSATQEVNAGGGTVTVSTTDQDMKLGPGVFVIWTDATTYTCAPGSFTMFSYDQVESVTIPITFRRA